jgi:hypothetical protein
MYALKHQSFDIFRYETGCISDPADSELQAAFEEFSQEKNGSSLNATKQLDRLNIMTTECHRCRGNPRKHAKRCSIGWKVCRVFVDVCVWWLKFEMSNYKNILNTSPSQNKETSPELNRRHKINQIGWEWRGVRNDNKSDGAILANDGIKDEMIVNKEWSYKKNGLEEMEETPQNPKCLFGILHHSFLTASSAMITFPPWIHWNTFQSSDLLVTFTAISNRWTTLYPIIYAWHPCSSKMDGASITSYCWGTGWDWDGSVKGELWACPVDKIQQHHNNRCVEQELCSRCWGSWRSGQLQWGHDEHTQGVRWM